MPGPAFRILGIPVRMEASFFLIVALLGFTGDLTFLLIWVPLVTVSVLVHELGHGIAFRAFGKRPQILLQGMGGLTSATGTLPPTRELVVSLAGPLTGLILIGLPALWLDAQVSDSSSDLDTALRILVFVNIAWSIVNLLPVLPLDGGRVTASVIHVVTGRPADRATHGISVVVAGVAALWALASEQLFLAMFAGFFVAYNAAQLAQMRNRQRLGELGEGYEALAGGDEDRALDVARAVSRSSSSATAVGPALELEAWALLRRGDVEGAKTALARMPPRMSPSPLLSASLALQRSSGEGVDAVVTAYSAEGVGPGPGDPTAADLLVRAGVLDVVVERLVAGATGPPELPTGLVRLQSDLHHAGRYDESVAVGERAFPLASEGAATVAYNVACSLARRGLPDEALTWLERAVESGFTDRRLLEEDPDLGPLRATAGFETLRRGLR